MNRISVFSSIALATGLLALTACTSDSGHQTTTTATSSGLYTAWACQQHPTQENFCSKFFSGTGFTPAEAENRAQGACGGSCSIMFVKPGCVPYRLPKSGRVLRPKKC